VQVATAAESWVAGYSTAISRHLLQSRNGDEILVNPLKGCGTAGGVQAPPSTHLAPGATQVQSGYQIRFYQISWLCRGPFATPVGERPAVQCSLRPMMLAAAAALGECDAASMASTYA